MTMSAHAEGFQDEFATIDLLLKSSCRTRGVDAFALALIKVERQVRRLVTYLVFQAPFFEAAHKQDLRRALSGNRDVYFDGLAKGLDTLSPVSLRELVGSDYDRLWSRLRECRRYRNKIFHGQLTGADLTRTELCALVNDMRSWCQAVSTGGMRNLRHDGFTNAFMKAKPPIEGFRVIIDSVDSYRTFVRDHMGRR